MPIRFKGKPIFSNPFIPWEALIQYMFSKLPCYNNCKAVLIKPLSGGLSGAVVCTIFPVEGGKCDPAVVKIDLFDLIEKEFSRYKQFLNNISDVHISKLLFPINDSDLPKIKGTDLEEYSIIAYSYALTGSKGSSDIYSFDEMVYSALTETKKTKKIFDIEKINYLLTALEKILYSINKINTLNIESRAFRPFDIPNIPWKTFLPLAVTASSLFPAWKNFVVELPKKWADIQNRQDPTIKYQPVICHGDLRCANILLIKVNNNRIKPFLIDYGLTGPAHILSDLPRLEADILLRVGLKCPDHIEIFNAVLEWDSLNPDNLSNKESHPILSLLSKIRKLAKSNADAYDIENEALIYRNYLLGNAVRFIRLNDPDLTKASNRQAYLWFVLSLAKRILDLESGETPSNLPLPLNAEAIFDIQSCGVKDFFWGPERRNKLKKDLILKGSVPVKLIAHTGKSYLDDTYNKNNHRNGRFYDDLITRLDNDNNFKMHIILLNPYSVEGSKLGIAEARGHLQGPELDLEYHEKHTELFKRFEICIDSYRSLRNKYPHNLELRISHYSTDATILFSDEVAFIEPYLIGSLSMRYTSAIQMNAPEFLVQRDSELYKVAKEQFNFLWQRAIELEEYESRITSFKDDFMRSERLRRKLVALHETWYALDPIVGCPNQCDYCFLTPFHLNNKPPFIYRSAKDAYERLENYPAFVWQKTLLEDVLENDPRLPVPIACGNYTEMMDKKCKYDLLLPNGYTRRNNTNFEQLKHIIRHHKRIRSYSGKIPILCLVTKQPLQDEFVDFLKEEIENNDEFRIAIFVSISFLPNEIERTNHGGYRDLVDNFKMISDLNNMIGGGMADQCRVAGIHYWRPLILELNSDDLDKKIQIIKDSGATSSVAVGLKLSKRLEEYIRFKGGLGGRNTQGGARYRFDLPKNIKNEYFDDKLKNRVVSEGERIKHPVFLNSSCSISHAFGRPDYNATFAKCSPPKQKIIDEVMKKCGIQKKVYELKNEHKDGLEKYWISIADEIAQEKQTFIRQMLGVEVDARVQTTHEWRGNISGLTFGRICNESYCPDYQQKICKDFYASRDRSG